MTSNLSIDAESSVMSFARELEVNLKYFELIFRKS